MAMKLFGAIQTSSSGLRGQRKLLEVVSENIANAQTTRTPEGGPYRRKTVVFTEAPGQDTQRLRRLAEPGSFVGLLRTRLEHMDSPRRVTEVELPTGSQVEVAEAFDADRFRVVYDPGHPDADEEGYVLMPNVNVVNEMVDLIAASRAYEANVSAIESAKAMFLQALEI